MEGKGNHFQPRIWPIWHFFLKSGEVTQKIGPGKRFQLKDSLVFFDRLASPFSRYRKQKGQKQKREERRNAPPLFSENNRVSYLAVAPSVTGEVVTVDGEVAIR